MMRLKRLGMVFLIGLFLLSGCGKEKKGAEILIKEMKNASVTEEELLTPGSKLANAILEATQIEVIEENKNDCKIKITYPDVKTVLEEALAECTGEPDGEAVDEILGWITQEIENGRISMTEEEIQLKIVADEAGEPQIEWTAEAARAMSGGLYDAE